MGSQEKYTDLSSRISLPGVATNNVAGYKGLLNGILAMIRLHSNFSKRNVLKYLIAIKVPSLEFTVCIHSNCALNELSYSSN